MTTTTTIGACTASPCNYDVGSINPLTNRVTFVGYGYFVKTAPCIVFVCLFAVSLAILFYQTMRSRRWYMTYTIIICGIGEVIGWVGRLVSSKTNYWDPSQGGVWTANKASFEAEIICLIIAPAFFMAMCYMTLGRTIYFVGGKYSRIHPSTYTTIFVSSDVLSILIQAAGGGIIAGAKEGENDTVNRGSNIVLAGVVWQLAVMICFSIILLDFVYNYSRKKTVKQFHPFAWLPNSWRARGSGEKNIFVKESTTLHPRIQNSIRMVILGLISTLIFVFVRTIYRTAAFIGGYTGPIETSQTAFDVLDGAMMLLAMFSWNFFHPGMFLPDKGGHYVPIPGKGNLGDILREEEGVQMSEYKV